MSTILKFQSIHVTAVNRLTQRGSKDYHNKRKGLKLTGEISRLLLYHSFLVIKFSTYSFTNDFIKALVIIEKVQEKMLMLILRLYRIINSLCKFLL